MALHALVYCERLFYLEEVEEIRVADAAVYAGRTLHEELDEPGDVVEMTLESAELGIRGRMDAFRRRDGALFPVEHKRGRARRDAEKKPIPWDSDKVQVVAYAMLLEEHARAPVTEGRIRYHKDNVTVRVPIGDEQKAEVRRYIARAKELSSSPDRPKVTDNERLCVRCSLSPVCLPEEARFTEGEQTRLAEGEQARLAEGAQTRLAGGEQAPKGETAAPVPSHEATEKHAPVRLYPPDTEARSVHVLTHGAKVSRSSDALVISELEGGAEKVGPREISDLVIHGYAQISTQALRLCAEAEIPVHYVTTSGAYLGTFSGPNGGVQRRIRQFRGLSDEALALGLARRLVHAKVEMQLRHVLRASRKSPDLRERVEPQLTAIRERLRGIARAKTREEMMGEEGAAARAYFAALADMVIPEAGEQMRPNGRTRRPPLDRFNALLSFGYSLLFKDTYSAILRVGLEPSFGILHQPRSSAFPLVLDLAELFRVPIVDLAVLAAVNRRTFDPKDDFAITGKQVWLSDTGRRKMIDAYERRKHEEYRHDLLGFSLSYARMMELETRLLEKEWSGEPGLFATFRIR